MPLSYKVSCLLSIPFVNIWTFYEPKPNNAPKDHVRFHRKREEKTLVLVYGNRARRGFIFEVCKELSGPRKTLKFNEGINANDMGAKDDERYVLQSAASMF